MHGGRSSNWLTRKYLRYKIPTMARASHGSSCAMIASCGHRARSMEAALLAGGGGREFTAASSCITHAQHAQRAGNAGSVRSALNTPQHATWVAAHLVGRAPLALGAVRVRQQLRGGGEGRGRKVASRALPWWQSLHAGKQASPSLSTPGLTLAHSTAMPPLPAHIQAAHSPQRTAWRRRCTPQS